MELKRLTILFSSIFLFQIIFLLSGFFFLVGIYFVLESACVHGFQPNIFCCFNKKRKKSVVVAQRKSDMNETQCTVDIESPDVMDSFISNANLTKEDEQRLR